MQKVVDVWSGSIQTYDGALQLLLLVDYVFDWARDSYRLDILQELKTIASGDNDAASSAYYSDPDVPSMRRVEVLPDDTSADEGEEYQRYTTLQDAFTAFDDEEGAIRHAAFVEYRYCCLFVTKDNVKTLVQSTNQQNAQTLYRGILDQMADCHLIDMSTLSALEEQWTGTSRFVPAGPRSEQAFYTVISHTTYLSGHWNQIRELYVVAISPSAWDDVAAASELQRGRKRKMQPHTLGLTDHDSLVTLVKNLRSGTPRSTLLDAIKRVSVKVRAGTSRISDERPTIPAYLSQNDGKFRHMVHYVYMWFKKGIIEPQEPFMRVSKRFVHQTERRPEVETTCRETEEPTLSVSPDGYVLIRAQNYDRGRERSESKICVYIVDGDPVMPEKGDLYKNTKRAIATADICHTTRDNGSSSLPSGYRTQWNLKQDEVYLGYHAPFDFVDLLFQVDNPRRHIEARVAAGSPRWCKSPNSHLNAARLCLPEPRYGLTPRYTPLRRAVAQHMFLIYKIVSDEINYWKGLAEATMARGIFCCTICADTSEDAGLDGLRCAACDDALRRKLGFPWVGRTLMGKAPFVDDERFVLWTGVLKGYPKLDEPFTTLEQLHSQCVEFDQWYRYGGPD